MKKLLFILCLFPHLIQAQDKEEEAIMVLPDLLVKGEVVNGQQTNTLIVTNYLNGSLLSKGSKTPAVFCKDSDEYKRYFKDLLYCVVHLKGHVQGCFFVDFVIKKRKIAISYIQGFDEDVIKEEIASIFKKIKIISPARNEKGKPIKTKEFLLIRYDVQTALPEDLFYQKGI
ncbi:hypothetical protein [Capnocytophaga sputigena]|jgi:hypothetical protein|uniref:hypothetical protein n=1 Tax=Capnocytophaga sputigena TaxID=1019 RepID=UPI0028EE6400|nr:hypothetical protein [Capnocytophaga sputigena]